MKALHYDEAELREAVEKTPYWDAIKIRVRLPDDSPAVARFGELTSDVNNVWVSWRNGDGSVSYATSISYGLALEILNDPRASPYHFDDCQEVHHPGYRRPYTPVSFNDK